MIFNKIFKEIIYPELKSYVETTSLYSPVVTKAHTEQSKVFPLVTVNLSRSVNEYNNLTYGEETYPFRIDINVYANDKTVSNVKISKIKIADEITDLVETYFKSNYRVTVNRQDDMENIDGTIRRNFIRISGVLDTKYGENNYVIYPK